jgi:acyl carrier protein
MSVENLPRSAIEKKLSTYWCELLGVEAVTREEHFLEAGGNSMMATLLANRIEDELGVRPSMEDLFGTLAQLASACEVLMAEGH